MSLLTFFGPSAIADTAGGSGLTAIIRPIPLTSSSCNLDTCQVVSGSGKHVSDWFTDTTAPSAVCTHAQYLENGTVIANSSSTCIAAGKTASADWSDPGSFPDGTVLCTQWVGIPGKPCATISG